MVRQLSCKLTTQLPALPFSCIHMKPFKKKHYQLSILRMSGYTTRILFRLTKIPNIEKWCLIKSTRKSFKRTTVEWYSYHTKNNIRLSKPFLFYTWRLPNQKHKIRPVIINFQSQVTVLWLTETKSKYYHNTVLHWYH